jgi:P27 family predicted phage terminase small subunit
VLNRNEPKPSNAPRVPAPPKHLNDEGKREWRRMGKLLKQAGLLTDVDVAGLSAYCTAWSRWVAAEEELKRFGTVMKHPQQAWPVQSPYLRVAQDAMHDMMRIATEFGMTPSSRSKISAAPTDNKDDQWQQFEKQA